MTDKKLKLLVVMFFVGLAGIIYSGYNTSEYTDNNVETEDIFDSVKAEEPDLTDTSKESLYEVYLCGCVVRPGVYKLPANSRLYEYLELAGGYTKTAAKDYENLARKVEDGERIYFPSSDEVKEYNYLDNETLPNQNDINGINNSKVNINTADVDELTTLTGIGESRAKSIIAHRQSHGSFKTIEDIMLVDGIKQSVFENIKDYITV